MNDAGKKPTSPRVGASRAKKEKIVARLSEKATRAKSLVFANYQGLTHVQLEQLKKALKKADAELTVTKNTLLKLALGKSITGQTGTTSTTGKNSPRDTSALEGPTATLFLYGDPIEPLKQLAKTIKELNLSASPAGGPTIKLGVIEGKELTSEDVMKLATLPPREVLIAQLVGQMKTPVYRLHRALGWNVQRLVMTLKAIEEKKKI